MSAYKVPILKVGDVLLVSIQSDIDDRTVLELQQRVLEHIERTNARAVLIDISLLEMVDSFTGRMLSDITSMASIMDAETVVVGIQPAVAITLVELGLELKGVSTALDVDDGLRIIRDRIREKDRKRTMGADKHAAAGS
ncbi:MAG TPA: STAS domain-containing protein [Blastocatellia bacterium]|jgi:rsbT antagonist protein RsbS|nr:STAS domain-containing protein [Blastocatellia bacterium]